jgi:hypothetical protein
MAAVGNTYVTLADLASRMEQGSVAKSIIELLNEQNEALDDIPWVECNDGSGHKTTVRTGIPSGTWRKLNYGVAQSKSTTAQVRDACGMLENYSTIDAALVKMAKDQAAFRLSESKPIIEGMNQEFMSTLIYGDTAQNPEKFMGLAPRFNALSGVQSADNVINGAGVGSDNTSIWLVVFGENSVHGIYPEGTKAGLEQKDLGEQTVYDASNNPYQAFRSHFQWFPGLSVRDWRQVVRIANIDVSDLTKNAATGADLLDLMVQALEKVHNLNMGKPVFLVNRTIRSFLRRQMMNRSNLLLSMEEVAGKKVLAFDGVPVRRCDAILDTEAAVS